MKKLICLIIGVILSVVAAGCATSNVSSNTSDTSSIFLSESTAENVFADISVQDDIFENTECSESEESKEVSEESIEPEESFIPEESSKPEISVDDTSDYTVETEPSKIEVSFSPDDFSAEQVFVYNVNTDEFCFEKNTDTVIVPASITKLLTALYALESAPADLSVKPGDELFLLKPYSSVAGLQFTDVFTLEQLVAAMLLPSGNDAAYTTAASVAKYTANNPYLSGEDAVTKFMAGMNEYALSIGCTDTDFSVPDGYAYTDHYTTAQDLVKIAKRAIQNPVISKYTAMSEYSFITENGHEFNLKSTNAHLRPSSPYYREGVTGLKTGTLNLCSLLVSFEIQGDTYIIGIINSATHETRFEDSCKIIDFLIRAYN